MKSRWPRAILIALVIGSCVGCDQVTKVLAEQNLVGHEPVCLFGGMVQLSYAENPGAFLGLGAGLPSEVRFWVFGVMVALVLALVAAGAIADRANGAVHLVGIAMIVGGGLGNLMDRANYGMVRDFVSMGIGSIRTGVLNVADLAITTGAILVLCSWRGRRTDPSAPTAP